MRAASLVLCLLAAGCESGSAAAAPETSGSEGLESDVLDIAGMTLPPLPHGVSVTRRPLEEGVRLARVSGEVERPPLPETATRAEVQAYVAGPLRDWMLLRGRALREVREALASAEDGDDGALVVAAAVIGVLYLRFALDLAELPLPDSVQSDPAERLGIRNALLVAASPLFDGAMSAFGACAQSSVGSSDPSLEPWERFCDDASLEAQDAPRPIDDGRALEASGAGEDEPGAD